MPTSFIFKQYHVAFAITALFCFVQSAYAANPIVDENNHVLWSNQSSGGTPPTIITASHTENGISLAVSAQIDRIAFLSSDASSDFSLKPGHSIELNVEGISFSSSDLKGFHQQLIFAISDSPDENLYGSSSNAIGIYFDASKGFRMGIKDGTPNAWPWDGTTLIPLTALAGVVTGFTLTLTNETYNLIVRTTSLESPVHSFEGSFSIGNGWDHLGIIAQYRKASMAFASGGVDIDNITLRSIPEPQTP